MAPIFWSLVCLALMLCMVGVELLTPAMGGFVIAALGFSAVSVYTGFLQSSSAGYAMLAANVALFPTSVLVGFQFLRKSPIINQAQNSDGIQSAPDSQQLSQLKGEIGKTITPLRPGGSILINDRKIDVVSEGKFIESGTVVKVIRVSGSTVVVEPV